MKIELIIGILFILVWVGVFLRKRICEEHKLIQQTEAGSLIDEEIKNCFEPLTKQEKIKAKTKHIDQMNAIQEKVSNSLIAKRFVDYRKSIAITQKDLELIKQSQDQYSFLTRKLHSLTADSGFHKEQLKKLSEIIDETFCWDDTSAMFSLRSENHSLALNMDLDENVELKAERCQEFINRVSKEIFENSPISLHITISDPEREEQYEAVIIQHHSVFYLGTRLDTS
jgi:hypothetical protein